MWFLGETIGKAVGGMARETYVRLRPLERVTRFAHVASTDYSYIVVLILDSEPAAKVEKPVGQTEGVEQLFRQYGQTVQGKVI